MQYVSTMRFCTYATSSDWYVVRCLYSNMVILVCQNIECTHVPIQNVEGIRVALTTPAEY